MNPVSIKRKVLLYMLGTFLAGLVAGGFGGYYWDKGHPPRHHSPEQMAEVMEKVLREKLNLSEEQAAKCRPILQDTALKIQNAFRETGQKMDGYFEESNRRLSEFLTPEQVEKLKELEQQRKRMFNKKGSPREGDAPKQGASLNKAFCASAL